MSLLASELSQVISELSTSLVGAVVQKIFLPRPSLCFLEMRQVGRSALLCLSAEPGGGRLSIAAARPPSPARAFAFQQKLRNELTGAKLESVRRGDSTRELWLDFAAPGGKRRLRATLLGAGQGLSLEMTPAAGAPEPSEFIERTETLGPPPRFAPLADAPFPWAEAAEGFGRSSERVERRETVQRQQQTFLRVRLKRLRRTLEKVRGEAARGPVAEQHRRFGELLVRHASKIPRGSQSVVLLEYGERGAQEVRVPLHPERSPKEEVAWNFHQYRRLQRGAALASERLRTLEAEEAELDRQLQAANASPPDLSPDLLLVETEAPPARGPKRRSVAKPYKTYVGAREGQIWVGKGGKDNDALTFRIARPNDLWLHVRGVAGAHVVISWNRAEAPPQELLLDAAHLAAHHSSSKGDPRVEVSHTRVKHVRKVKGGAPGSVTYTQEKTFLLRLEPDRLERLLRSRLPSEQ